MIFSNERANRSASAIHSALFRLRLGFPSLTPLALADARPAFVLWEIKSASISAASPKVLTMILLGRSASSCKFCFTKWAWTFFFRSWEQISWTSLTLLASREISLTIKASPGLMTWSNSSILRLRNPFLVADISSSIQSVTARPFLSAYCSTSSFWD